MKLDKYRTGRGQKMAKILRRSRSQRLEESQILARIITDFNSNVNIKIERIKDFFITI